MDKISFTVLDHISKLHNKGIEFKINIEKIISLPSSPYRGGPEAK